MKFEYFSECAKRVMLVAEQEARSFKYHYVGTEHVLLGLLSEDSDIVAEVFQTFGVNAEKVRREITKLLPTGPAPIGEGELPLTPRVRRAIELARRESESLGLKSVDAEHLLLGLVYEPGGVAGKVLRNLGVKLELLGPAVFRVRLEQMKIVERVVRPVRAGVPRKRKMREELLAHLTAIYEEEKSAGKDSAAALTQAALRLGNSGKLACEFESTLPWSERFSFAVERHFGWRAPESAERYCLRLGINFGICMASCIAVPLLVESLLINQYNTPDWWMVVRLGSLFLFWLSACLAVLTWIYLKMRDAMWGAFGSRKSALHVAGFAGMMTAFTFVFMLLFLAIEEWNPDAAAFWAWRAALAAVGVAIVYLFNARTRGNEEIKDTIWASLKLD